jgi:predicted MFS family arabinose efflux permease
MPSYRSLLAIREFRVLFVNRCVVYISIAASGLAMGTITYGATRSAVLTGLSMFGGPLVSVVAAQFLLAASDSVRPRTALMLQTGAAFAADALQCVPGMPWQARFLLLAIPYVANSMFSGTQWVIVGDIVPDGSFVLARSALNLAAAGMQVLGYGVGGLVLLWLSPRGLFCVAAVADLASMINVRLGVRDRPARAGRVRASRGPNVARRTVALNRRLLGSPVTRPLYLAMWIPNGLIVGCESLFVPYGHDGHRSVAGFLFSAAAAGMMAGYLTVGRCVPERRRDGLIEPLRLLLAVPYGLLFLAPAYQVTLLLVFAASFGYSASLPLQERLIRHTAGDVRGQVMGLYSQGLMAGQSIGALIAGTVATSLRPGLAMGVMGTASITVTLVLIPGLRRSARDLVPLPDDRKGHLALARDLPGPVDDGALLDGGLADERAVGGADLT